LYSIHKDFRQLNIRFQQSLLEQQFEDLLRKHMFQELLQPFLVDLMVLMDLMVLLRQLLR
jgi:hypothetical protein